MTAQRYALIGAVAGFLFPAVGTFIEAQLHHDGSLGAAQASSPLLWIIDTAPVILAFLAWMVGRRQDQVLELEEGRVESYAKTAVDLSAAATALFQSVSAFSAMTADTAASVQEVTQTMTALSQTAMRAALTAETVIGLAQKSARSSEEGLRAVEVTSGGMAKLAEEVNGWATHAEALSGRMRDISAITAVMGHMADRTQALATEARGEAERAGAAGVVRAAGQMLAHAAEAAATSGKARQMVAEMEQAVAGVLAAIEAGRQQATAHAASAAGTGRTIRALAATIRDSSGVAKEIATVAQQQDRGIEEVLKAMNGIFLSVQEAVSQTARVAAQARSLSDLATGLKGQGH